MRLERTTVFITGNRLGSLDSKSGQNLFGVKFNFGSTLEN